MEEKETVPCFILKLPLRVDSAGRRVFARDFLYALQFRNALWVLSSDGIER